jgi:hypothetical protein
MASAKEKIVKVGNEYDGRWRKESKGRKEVAYMDQVRSALPHSGAQA